MIELIDDLDGSVATQTVSFALDEASYEMELSDENAEALRSSLAPFAEKARRAGGRKQSASEIRTGVPNPKAVRVWAVAHGLDVNPRGRVSDSIVQQYLAAN
ncbi:Lsr2 family protein [Arthrobacter sp. ISL-65]|nr:Lsr2 family protein [Arthrobacter sp. ISL-65]